MSKSCKLLFLIIISICATYIQAQESAVYNDINHIAWLNNRLINNSLLYKSIQISTILQIRDFLIRIARNHRHGNYNR